MSVEIPPAAAEILRGKTIAHVAVIDGDRPHVSPIWIDLQDDGSIVLNTAVGRVKERLLQVGAPVTISAPHQDNPYSYALVWGEVAERTKKDGVEVINRLSQKYTGRDFDVPPGQVRLTVRIRPHKVISNPS